MANRKSVCHLPPIRFGSVPKIPEWLLKGDLFQAPLFLILVINDFPGHQKRTEHEKKNKTKQNKTTIGQILLLIYLILILIRDATIYLNTLKFIYYFRETLEFKSLAKSFKDYTLEPYIVG